MIDSRFMCRGKRVIHDKPWVYGYYVPTHRQRDGVLIDEYTHYLFVGNDDFVIDPNTLGQCTGVRDINDALIFEGDIVLDRAHSAGSGGYEPIEVAYKDGEWLCMLTARDRTIYYPLSDFSSTFGGNFKLEVVGNIHDGIME